MRLISAAFGVFFFGSLTALFQCGSSSNLGTANPGSDGGHPFGEVPLKHFPAGSTCRSTRPAGDNVDDGGQTCDAGTFCECGSDGECTSGVNGRCVTTGNGPRSCTYDQCATSADCTAASTSCACGDIYTSSYNTCVPSNCKTDGDCGANGYCSPSYGSCGTFGGEYEGIYCHTAGDGCVNDGDCTGNGTSNVPGFCAFDTEAAKWSCNYTVCSG